MHITANTAATERGVVVTKCAAIRAARAVGCETAAATIRYVKDRFGLDVTNLHVAGEVGRERQRAAMIREAIAGGVTDVDEIVAHMKEAS